MTDDDLTTAYLLGAEQMRDKLHKQAEEIERLKADIEYLKYISIKMADALRPFTEVLKGNYSNFTNELPILAGASANDLQFTLKIGDFRSAHFLVEELDNKNYSNQLPILNEYENKLTILRAENEKLREALKPFADAVTDEYSWKYDINSDDFRAAQAALGETDE